jgi:uncharacterized protein (UPF0332 family)
VTEKEAKAEVVRYWWDRAQESLGAARRELAAGAYAFAMNRAYYALFYAVSALLLEEGCRFKKHSGVRATFNREIIKTGEWLKIMVTFTTRSSMIDKPAITSNLPALTPSMYKKKLLPARIFSLIYGRS